jgi:hypothetical protein
MKLDYISLATYLNIIVKILSYKPLGNLTHVKSDSGGIAKVVRPVDLT